MVIPRALEKMINIKSFSTAFEHHMAHKHIRDYVFISHNTVLDSYLVNIGKTQSGVMCGFSLQLHDC